MGQTIHNGCESWKIRIDRIEGDMRTPIGVYSIPWAFGTARNPGTKLNYKNIDSNTYYDGQYGSPTYNTLVEGKPNDNEYEYMDIMPYRYGSLINFNSGGQPGKGNAVFLHCSTASGYTSGCVSINSEHMVRVLRWLDPGQNPLIIICTSSQYG
jgi:L,D-peptidoglycan transpeptidase YkuD (ErfK/YbiS/YcfS/YnhG family)